MQIWKSNTLLLCGGKSDVEECCGSLLGRFFFAFCQEFNFQIETRGTKEFRERCSISCGHNGATLSPEKVGMRVYYVAMIKMN